MSIVPFDVLVLTAANEAQAEGYRAQLREREERGALPHVRQWRVVADAGGQRIGSGAATMAVLAELATEVFTEGANYAERFAHRRVLLVHSGGDARRLPAYAALGKVFLPLPCEIAPTGREEWRRHPAALLDLLLQTLVQLPAAPEGELLLCSGDVLLTFDAARTRLDAAGGVMGVGFAVTPEVGSHHGVYLAANPSVGGAVTGFLQKPTLEQMRVAGAADSSGRILVDTGVMNLAPHAIGALLDAANAAPSLNSVVESGETVDWYQEIAAALVPGVNRESYLAAVAGKHSPEAMKTLGAWFDRVQAAALPFRVCAVPDGEFFHVGTTRDLSTKLTAPSRTAQTYGFRNDSADPNRLVFNSTGANGALPPGAVYVESCDVARMRALDSGAGYLIGVDESALGGVKLRLGPDCGLTSWPVRVGNAVRAVPLIFAVGDDYKSDWDNSQLTIGGSPLQRLWDAGIKPRELWPAGVERTLWSARLWGIGPRRGEALAALLEVLRDGRGGETLRTLWKEPRRSLAELLKMVDHAALLQHRHRLEAAQRIERLPADAVRFTDFPAREAQQWLQASGSDAGALAARLQTQIEAQHEPLVRARLAYLKSTVLVDQPERRLARRPNQLSPARAAEELALQEVARAVEGAAGTHAAPRPAAILHDQAVWATAPARIDLAGGWSDTPPICTERGGTVLNAAVRLNGQYPLQVVAKLNTEGCIRLTSIDLGRHEVLKSATSFQSIPSFAHWSALVKTALALSGIVPDAWAKDKSPLKGHLDILGGGLDITVFSGLPQGSGLGSSSILGAAVLACLARVRGEEFSHADLIVRTSALEQRMTSGGGWQDQAGGIVPGVKLLRTQPGLVQIPSMQWTPFGGAGVGAQMLRSRMLLLFTGQKRVARNILRTVVGRYLAREPEVLTIIERLKEGAEAASQALAAGDIIEFAARLNEYWELKKAFDPGSTNAEIEGILGHIAPYTAAACGCGASGGGFMTILARDNEAADAIRQVLKRNLPHPNARFFDWEIDEVGLSVSVL